METPLVIEGEAQPANPYDFDALDAQDLTPKEIRGIRWRKREYVLKAASADAVIQFNNKRFQQARMDDGKLVAIAGGAELSYFLVSKCLFEVGARPDGSEVHKALNEQLLRATWPNHFVDKLFNDAKRISHIDDDARTIDQKIADCEKELAKLRKERDRLNPPPALGADGGETPDEELVHIDQTQARGAGATGQLAPGGGTEELVGNSSGATGHISA